MSKGSGRRRITPSDGLRFNEDTEMTNIEERGASHTQSAKKELRLGLRTGARPTTESFYGNQGRRRGGVGRKDDHRSWKSRSKGKQYEKNLEAREEQKHHRPAPEKVKRRLREMSINHDIRMTLPCKAFSVNRRMASLSDWVDATEKFLVKHGGDSYKGYAAMRARPYQYPGYGDSYRYYSQGYVQPEPPVVKFGFAAFEQTVARILEYKSLGMTDYSFQ